MAPFKALQPFEEIEGRIAINNVWTHGDENVVVIKKDLERDKDC